MPELTLAQVAILRRLDAQGFAPAAFPLYPNAIGIHRGSFVVLLEMAAETFRPLGEPYYLLDGNLGVCVEAEGRRWFVWKSKRVEATPELLAERQKMFDDLTAILLPQP